ncbi:MAG: enoyl-CoA hydratase-related protein [Planctomycetota bacterium]|jgi:2-(1,2-epoxy-1,2-dihydrophenyl)acetyl-CoA isomerase
MTTATAGAYETIAVETADHVCTITLNRPDVLNAINDAVTTELGDALKAAARDADVRVVVITGAGRAFSSGQDLGDLKKRYVPGYVPELGDNLRRRYNPVITRIREMDKPVIAAVNGVAAGAGCSLALACDLRVASADATFIEVFINVGLIPDSGSTFMLPRLVGLGRAMEMCFTGGKVAADEAARIGLVNKVVDPDRLMEETRSLAGRLARLPARGMALTKRLLNESFDHDLRGQLEAEAFAQETAGRTKDHFEGVTAFLEKRKPSFTGE